MRLFKPAEARLASAIGRLAYCNPFSKQSMEAERDVLQREPSDADPELFRQVWASRSVHPDVEEITRRTAELAEAANQRLKAGQQSPSDAEMRLFEDLALYQLYLSHRVDFIEQIDRLLAGRPASLAGLWTRFDREFTNYFGPGDTPVAQVSAAHVFALFFQIQRAHLQIYMNIVGASKPAIALRETVWQSIFTCDLRRYARILYRQMDKCATLVTGPSGTGKELVARAVGWSRYIPFHVGKRVFAADFTGSFLALNLSAFAPTLIESELFGHARGAFNGAVDRQGWLQRSDPWSTVFLDEIGELDPAIQVKLLRVLQNREFQRVGESKAIPFHGKVIAATNRDLAAEMQADRFRPDLFYRLQSDLIVTPALHEQLADSPDDLRKMVLFIARRETGEDSTAEAPEAENLADEVVRWIEHRLPNYSWPGNFRELEQCVRNIMIRNSYLPLTNVPKSVGVLSNGVSVESEFLAALYEARLSLDDLEGWYFTRAYFRTGNYQEAARRLGTDWRTLKKKVDAGLLRKFRAE